jgi:hypothetical protein
MTGKPYFGQLRFQRSPALAESVFDQFGFVVYTQLAHHIASMGFHRLYADA